MDTDTTDGHWELLPELSFNDNGPIPTASVHFISTKNNSISIDITTVFQNAKPIRLNFGGPLDGSRQAVQTRGITHINFTTIDKHTLENCAFNNDNCVMRTTRKLSSDGQLMTLTRQEFLPNNTKIVFQVFRRAHDKSS